MIDPTTYQDYSNYLSSLIEDEYNINDYLQTMSDEISQINSSLDDSEAFNFYSTINASHSDNVVKYINEYSLVDNAIVSLQLNIISNYGDINNFLSDNNIVVKYYFALSSDRLGFTINDNNIEYVLLGNGDLYSVVYNDTRFRIYSSDDTTTATITVYGQNFVVGNIDGDLVWDISGTSHTFTVIGESISVSVGIHNFNVTWLGYPDSLFEIIL